jgi:hypothetical protein
MRVLLGPFGRLGDEESRKIGGLVEVRPIRSALCDTVSSHTPWSALSVRGGAQGPDKIET